MADNETDPVTDQVKEPDPVKDTVTTTENLKVSDIENYLTANSHKTDVKEYMKKMKSDREFIGKFLDTDDGKKIIQPVIDKRVTNAIQTYRDNHFKDELKAAIDAEVLRMNPDETEDQKRLRVLEADWVKEKKARQVAELNSVAVKYANSKGLTNVDKLVERLFKPVANDEETMMAIDDIIELIQLKEQQASNRVMAKHAKIPQNGENQQSRFADMDELQRYLQKNPGSYEKIKEEYYRLTNKIG